MERALTNLGVEVTTLTSDDDGTRQHNGKPCGVALSENGVTRLYFPKQVEFYKVALGMVPWLWRNARGFDVVHIHALFSFSSIAAALVARLRHVPYVLRPLGTLTRYGVTQRRPWLKQLSLALFEGPALRRAAAVHFTSEDELLEAAQCGIAMKGVVIPLGIDTPALATDALMRAHYPALQGAPYLLYLSRLDPKKNVEGLLHAFAQCHAELPGIKLLIAGSGAPDYVASLAQLAGTVGLNDHVIWAGHVEGDLKASALAGALLFVLPSFSENFGIAAAEALMAGLPCVLGQGVALSRDVVDAGAGVAVLPDPASISAGLMLVMADLKKRAAMSKNAADLANKEYSAQVMGKNMLQLYSGILKK